MRLIVRTWRKSLFFDVFGDDGQGVARGELHGVFIRANDAHPHVRMTALRVIVFDFIIFVVLLFERLGTRGIERAIGRRGIGRGQRKVLPAENAKRDEVSVCLEILFTDNPNEASVLGNLYFWAGGIGEHMSLVRIWGSGKKPILGIVIALQAMQEREEDVVLGMREDVGEMKLGKVLGREEANRRGGLGDAGEEAGGVGDAVGGVHGGLGTLETTRTGCLSLGRVEEEEKQQPSSSGFTAAKSGNSQNSVKSPR